MTHKDFIAKMDEEFLNHPELAGSTGYCNPIMAKKIADFYSQKFQSVRLSTLTETQRIIERYFPEVKKLGDEVSMYSVWEEIEQLKK